MYTELQDAQKNQSIHEGRPNRGVGAAAALAFPELTLVPRLLRGAGRRWAILVVVGSLAFIAAVAAAIFIWNGANAKTARAATARFGAALVQDAPHAAPPGAAAYVNGVRAYFGPVTSARLIGAHQRAVGHDPDSRTFYVAELLLDTRRGPAVVEVEFDNGAVNSDRVSSVYELAPDSAPGLTVGQHRELDAAFAARGGKPADAATLALAPSTDVVQGAQLPSAPDASAAAPSAPGTARPVPALSTPVNTSAAKQLRCVQAAHHDVAKLARCAP